MKEEAGPVSGETPRAGIELLRATKPFVRERPLRSWADVLSTLAILAALLAIAAWPLPAYGRIGAGFLAGLVVVRAFVLYHDYQHGAILRRSRIARALMSLYGMLTLSPPSPWNRSHNHHHQNNSKMFGAAIGSFPLMSVKAYRQAGRGQRLRYAAARHPLTILFGYVTIFLVGMTLRPFLLDPKRHLDCLLALVLHGSLIGVLAWADPATLLYALVLPLFVASAAGAYLFYAQHNFPDAKLQSRADWDLVSAAMQASSCMALSPVLAWVTANIGYHHVHHLNARIPNYRLAEAIAAIPELQNPGRTGLGVGDIRACLRLKLWDAEQGRMVTFSGRA